MENSERWIDQQHIIERMDKVLNAASSHKIFAESMQIFLLRGYIFP